MSFPHNTLHLVIFLFCTALSPLTYGQAASFECGSLQNHYGPFDYRTATPDIRALVERAHFTPRVERLIGGMTSATAGGDMGYTLRVFPNHHRALMAAMKLAEKEKTDKPRDLGYSVACYFDRAERFKPDDAMVKTIHGIYLIRSGKPQAGKEKLEAALSLAEDNANIYYNLGLAYFALRQFDKSLESAHRAYALGFPLPGLRNKLKHAGKWQEPMVKTGGSNPSNEMKEPESAEVPTK